jgi:hypothetical protein
MPHPIRSPFITSPDGNTSQYTSHAMTVTSLTLCNTRCQQCLLDASSIDEVQSACTPDGPLLRYLFHGDTPWVDIKMVAGKWFVFDARYMQFIWESSEERSVAIIFPLSTCNTIGAYLYRSLTFPYQRMADFTPWYQDPIGCVQSLMERFSLPARIVAPHHPRDPPCTPPSFTSRCYFALHVSLHSRTVCCAVSC